jgi:hypothetical protein
MPHSNDVRAFDIGDTGVRLLPLGRDAHAAKPRAAKARAVKPAQARRAR